MQIEDDQLENERQAANTFLRERFLFLISSICGKCSTEQRENRKTCTICMYDNTEVTADLKAFDLNFENIIVENLKTPIQELKHAILRTCDIITITYK